MTYVAYRTKAKIVVDGKFNEKAWKLAPKSPRFVDIINGGPALDDTRPQCFGMTNTYTLDFGLRNLM